MDKDTLNAEVLVARLDRCIAILSRVAALHASASIVISDIAASSIERALQRTLAELGTDAVELGVDRPARVVDVSEIQIYQRGHRDQDGVPITAMRFFQIHWKSKVDEAAAAGAPIFGEELRHHDPGLYQALAAHLKRQRMKFADLGLAPSRGGWLVLASEARRSSTVPGGAVSEGARVKKGRKNSFRRTVAARLAR